MRFARQSVLLAVLLALAAAESALAQRAPRRPRLADQADTNDAALYFQWALERVERNPEQAYAGFYWAARLDPTAALPLYGQWATTLLGNNQTLVRYVQRERRTMTARDVIVNDSLRLRAETIDPFYHRMLEGTILLRYAAQANRAEGDPFAIGGRQASSVGGGDVSATRTVMSAAERYFEQNDPYSRGGLAYGVPDLRQALQFWAQATRTNSLDWIWADRARAFAEMRQWDSALANIVTALDTRRSSEDMQRRPWERRAQWYYVMGRIMESKRDAAGARDAYGNAVHQDDNMLGAVLQLALLNLAARDTATAVAGLIRVAEHPAAEFHLLASAASTLTQVRRFEPAVTAMRRATTIEPLASAGWLILGRSLEASRDTAGAVGAYERYLALAPQNDAPRIAAQRALGGLRPSAQ